MTHPHWPLFDLRLRTPALELRPPVDEDLVKLATLAAGGVHDPSVMPFTIPWTDAEPPELQRNALQWWWRQRADWRPERWSLCFAVAAGGELVGIQDINASDFVRTRTVLTGSWLGRAHQGKGIGKEIRAAVLHFAFAGLDAELALTSAWHDNQASLAVTRSLGYEPNGEHIDLRRGVADTQLHFRMSRAAWSEHRRDDIAIEGLAPCLPLFGLS